MPCSSVLHFRLFNKMHLAQVLKSAHHTYIISAEHQSVSPRAQGLSRHDKGEAFLLQRQLCCMGALRSTCALPAGMIEKDLGGSKAITLYETLATMQLPLPVGRYQTARYSLLKVGSDVRNCRDGVFRGGQRMFEWSVGSAVGGSNYNAKLDVLEVRTCMCSYMYSYYMCSYICF